MKRIIQHWIWVLQHPGLVLDNELHWRWARLRDFRVKRLDWETQINIYRAIEFSLLHIAGIFGKLKWRVIVKRHERYS